MGKRHQLSEVLEAAHESGATTSLPRPADSPLASIESRAAARLIFLHGGLREGDKGVSEDGFEYFVMRDPKTQTLIKIM